jgi:hypothetical protein
MTKMEREPQGRVPVPRPAKQQNNLSASLPWNGRWGFFLCITFLKKQTTMKRETKIDLKKALREKT